MMCVNTAILGIPSLGSGGGSVPESDIFRVRRSTDSAEADYTLTEVDDGTLDTFVGAGDGCVATWYDDSGNDNDVVQATTTLQPKVAVSGVVQEGVVFDGSNDYFPLTVADVTLAGQTSVTFCCWIRPTNVTGNRVIFTETTSTVAFARFGLWLAAGAIKFYTRDAAADPEGTLNTLTSSTLTVDTWYHLAIVYTTNSKKVYVNGSLAHSSTPTTGAFGSSTSNGIRIGALDNNLNFFAGHMSDIRLYRGTALTAPQIATLASGGEVGSPLLWLKGNYSP